MASRSFSSRRAQQFFLDEARHSIIRKKTHCDVRSVAASTLLDHDNALFRSIVSHSDGTCSQCIVSV
jgi:hypothetical protein